VFRAVVFAYSEVGFRCLRALLDEGVDVPLVFTHRDAPGEVRWFGSVAQLASDSGIDEISTEHPDSPQWAERLVALEPHYLLSFYYRAMLSEQLLKSARWGALNMHGSLLPKYRGRAPVNWAILNGERETGATLHYMVSKPDAGAIVAQQAVPIGINDTALTVSLAVAQAAAELLTSCLSEMAEGPPAARPMDLAAGSYYGGRKPEDGRIDWAWPAARIHALIRAVAPPFPGAFTDLATQRIVFGASRWTGEPAHSGTAQLYAENGEHLYLDCVDGYRLEIPSVTIDGQLLDGSRFAELHGEAPLPLNTFSASEIVLNEKAAHSRR
jgi:methionyl-tRNA formyltransferase